MKSEGVEVWRLGESGGKEAVRAGDDGLSRFGVMKMTMSMKLMMMQRSKMEC